MKSKGLASSPSNDAVRRVAAARSVMLFDPEKTTSVLESAGESIFDPAWWRASSGAEPAAAGRGSAWYLSGSAGDWVLRHYRRGGMPGKVLHDRYLWLGEARVRSFTEWRITALLHARGLPVPAAVAARYVREGFTYRCDLITRRIAGARPVSDILASDRIEVTCWRAIGASVAAIHAAGVDHADLNAHNILLDAQGRAAIIDFDRARLRAGGAWRRANLWRFERSLRKISAGWPGERYTAGDWQAFLSGYRRS